MALKPKWNGFGYVHVNLGEPVAKQEEHTTEALLVNLASERKQPWCLQLVQRTLTTNDKKVVKNVTTIHFLRFQKYKDVETFAVDVIKAIKHKSMLGKSDDAQQDNDRRRTARRTKQITGRRTSDK